MALNSVEVFGFYFPLGEAKIKYWDWLLANATKLKDSKVILMGDFNTGKVRIDEAAETFDCQNKHEALETLGFVDTWRAAYSRGRDSTWYSTAPMAIRIRDRTHSGRAR